MRRSTVLSTLAVLFLTGCASQTLLRFQPGKAVGLTEAKQPTLYVTSQPADPDKPLTAKTLQDRTGAAYVSALAAHETKPDKLRALMAKPVKKEGDDSDPDDFARVLVIDLQRNGVRPADRFIATEVDVRPTTAASGGPDYIFTDYQAASTSSSSISIGTVTVTNQTTGTLSATPAFGAAVSQGTASYSVESTNASTHNISETSQLSVNAAPRLVTVLRAGGEGIDLVGNTLVKLTVRLPEGTAEPIFIADPDVIKDDGTPKPPNKAKVKITAKYFVPAHDIYACAKLRYVDRQVTAGAENRDEGQQSVNFVSDQTAWEPYLIIPKTDMKTSLWVIMTLNAAMKPETALQMETGLGAVTLYFDDYNDAQQFRGS